MIRAKLEELRVKALTLRNIRNTVANDGFEELFDKATVADQRAVINLIDRLDAARLRAWVRQQLGYERIVDLKERARIAGIPCYSRMSKDELICVLDRVSQNIRDANAPKHDSTDQDNRTLRTDQANPIALPVDAGSSLQEGASG